MPETLTVLIQDEYNLDLSNQPEGLKTHGYPELFCFLNVAAKHILVNDVILSSSG